MSVTRRSVASLVLTAGVLAGSGLILAQPAQAHGYVSAPYSRAVACKLGLNTGCGSIVYEPQSLEAPKGFPATGPADGRIASAGGAYPELDAQAYGRWYKNNIATGPLSIDWTYTAPHRTSQWRYYMTKQSWDPNAPLKRSDLELIATVAHDGSAASNNKVHTIQIPANRSGYHVILAVWDVADTANAFYNVIDVNVTGGGAPLDTQPPTVPGGLASTGQTSSSVDLTWSPSTDNVGVSAYVVTRNGVDIARTSATRYVDSGLAAGAAYTYAVRAIDAAGNSSAPSPVLTVRTNAVVTPTPTPTPTPSVTPTPTTTPTPTASTGTAPQWSATGRYAIGDRVTYAGRTYVCIQAYQGWGDPNWINAPSLWTAL